MKETNIHYPTDSSLLGEGAHIVTRMIKKIETKAGGLKNWIRDCMRTVKKRVRMCGSPAVPTIRQNVRARKFHMPVPVGTVR